MNTKDNEKQKPFDSDSQKVSTAYPDLMHYTSATGLNGILESKSLWATHASFLNDTTEIKLFFDRRLQTLIRAAAGRLSHNLPEDEEAELVSELSAIVRGNTLAFNQIFICSLCKPPNAKVATDGLLSQWRGYGPDGGYAMVLDSAALENAIEEESKCYDYQHIEMADVHYFDEPPSHLMNPEIQEAEEIVTTVIAGFLEAPQENAFEAAYHSITSLSCLYRDPGFSEENEVRIIVVPTHSSARPDDAATALPQKPISAFVRGGCLTPYVSLFTRSCANREHPMLPIKRIIVGPHRDSERRQEAVRIMLESYGIKAAVQCSKIPYAGH